MPAGRLVRRKCPVLAGRDRVPEIIHRRAARRPPLPRVKLQRLLVELRVEIDERRRLLFEPCAVLVGKTFARVDTRNERRVGQIEAREQLARRSVEILVDADVIERAQSSERVFQNWIAIALEPGAERSVVGEMPVEIDEVAVVFLGREHLPLPNSERQGLVVPE